MKGEAGELLALTVFLTVVTGLIVGLIVLFHGDPDIADALREVALKWAGLK